MEKNNFNFNSFMLLAGFAILFSMVAIIAARVDRSTPEITASSLASNEVVDTVVATSDEAAEEASDEAAIESSTTISVSAKETTAMLQKTVYTVSEYESPVRMYASDTVNVRSGAGTDYDKLGKLSWGSEATVTGETDNGWYEVLYGDVTAFIRGDYMVSELPGIPYLFVGDSRTVQLEMAVGSSDKAYIAEVGEGYSYFKNTALSQISNYAGQGTNMIINFGVNDLANASKYIELVNNNIDAWTAAGITVYYAAVTPVGEGTTVSNAQIENFNSKLHSELDSRVKWIDGYSYLSQTGFSTPDGLHYNADTYKNLYYYYLSVIGQA